MTGFDDFLNFIMPPLVIAFVGFIFYRIPMVKQGITSLTEKIRGWRENRKEGGYTDTMIPNSINYE